jgi:hypothetical protein
MPKKERPLSSRKKSHKGIPCRRGKPILYEEVKTKINLTLTPSTIHDLTRVAESEGISRSELVEQLLRTHLPMRSPLIVLK